MDGEEVTNRGEEGGGGDEDVNRLTNESGQRQAKLQDSFVNLSMASQDNKSMGPDDSEKGGGINHLLPIRCEKAPKDELPLSSVGFINYMTFGWLTGYMWDVFRHGLGNIQGLRISGQERSDINAHRLERFWQEEVRVKGQQESSFAKAILRSFRTRLLIGAMISLLNSFLTLANPMLVIPYFLEYLVFDDVTVSSGIKYVVCLALIIVLHSLSSGVFWMLNFEAAARIKYGTLALLYKKITRLKTLGDKSVGDMVNFISNDGQRLWDGIIMGPFIISGPMILIMSCVYSIVYLGPWALIAWIVILGFYPFMMTFAKMSQKFREQGIAITDKRVALMSELLTSIRLVKMYAWDQLFGKKISEIRAEERAILEKSDLVMSIGMGSSMMVPIFASCLTFVGYVGAGNNLTPVQAFTFMALLNAMQGSLASIPFGLKSIAELVVSTQRMKEVLLMEELKYDYGLPSQDSSAMELVKANFSWSSGVTATAEMKNGTHENKSKKKKKGKESGKEEEEEEVKLRDDEIHTQIYTGPTLHNITFTLNKGQLVGVCGHVGGGKSSLISALLGKMNLTSGTVAMAGRVAYVPQQSWVMNDTIRGNILFENDYEPERYRKVLEACALKLDIDSFPSGDITEVGECGATLSGGQKQRISLARAAYSKSDLLLLDDPLSAVDVQLGRHIFEHCVRGLLKGRTVLLVTHQLQYLQHCDHILVMKEGSLAEQGSHDQLISNPGEYSSLLSHYSKDREKGEEEEGGRRNRIDGGDEGRSISNSHEGGENSESVIENHSTSPTLVAEEREAELALLDKGDKSKDSGGAAGQLIEEEEMGTGNVSASAVNQYIQAVGGYFVSTVVLICFSLPVAGVTTASWFLSYWLEQGGGGANMTIGNITVPSPRVLDNPDKDKYLLIYAMFIPILIVTMVLRSYSLVKATLRASSKLHDKGFLRVLQSPLSFFDSTPVGRIVNRFSADLDELDTRLPMNMEIFLTNSLQIIAALAMIAYVSPWFLLAVIPLGMLFFFLMAIFHTCIREMKRWDNVSRSPVLSHMGTSVQGLASIQAYSRTKQFEKRHCELLNSNCVAVLLFYAANRWLAIRLDFVAAAVTFVTGLLILLTFDLMTPAMAGLALSFCVQMSALFQFMARMVVETEARFTSVERILKYCNISDREMFTFSSRFKTPDDWPRSGAITFDNVQLRYRSGLPLALKGVSLEIEPQQKVGIVGRSGAGKTSLSAALFRLVELEDGIISIDNLDITQLPLQELRSKISAIPQDPVLFSGTIRYNLDPFGQFSDADIWQALDKCHIADMVKNQEQQLGTLVVENGDNFSVGERQLLCMARALIRNSRVLVLDEATAAIDPETDALIQKTLKEAFSSCSMLFIAHRLNTVIGCDKILVMEDGEVLEFDTPSNLLSNPESKFKAMLEASKSSSSRTET